MCVIYCKPKGVEFASDEVIKNMFDGNPDGSGICWAENGKIHLCKGMMTLPNLMKKINQLKSRLCLRDTALIIHFRITTHGGTNQQMTHPFPISASIPQLKQLKMKTDLCCAHNGIISSVTPRAKDVSDTAEFIASRLSLIRKIVPDFYKNKNCMKLIEEEIKSKMAFLTPSGNIYTVGKFVKEEDGSLFSNDSYKARTYYYSSDYGYRSGYYGKRYGNYSAYGSTWDDDEWEEYAAKYNTKKEDTKEIPWYLKSDKKNLLPASVEDKIKDDDENDYLQRSLCWLDPSLACIKSRVTGEYYDGNFFLVDEGYNVYQYDWDSEIAIRDLTLSVATYSSNSNELFEEDDAELFYWVDSEDVI